MAKLNFAVLCGRLLVDHATQVLSLIDVVDEIAVTIPSEGLKEGIVFIIQNPMELVLDFSRSKATEPEIVKAKVNVRDPNGTQIGGSEVSLDLQAARRGRMFVKLAGFPVTSAGTYTFDIQTLRPNNEWSTIHELTLLVRFQS